MQLLNPKWRMYDIHTCKTSVVFACDQEPRLTQADLFKSALIKCVP
jgi:hypothetical protein